MTRRHTLISRRGEQSAAPYAAAPNRREALMTLLAAASATMSACSRPREVIEPFADDPATYAQGLTERYATTLSLAGYGRGVVGLVRDGRPFKLEGNARHPASLGGTDVFTEAAVLDLFDPQRSQTPSSPEGPASWDAIARLLPQRLGSDGAGTVLLTGRITSPTVLATIARVQTRYPALRHVRYEPVNDDAAMAGAQLAFGRPVTLRPRFAEAEVVVCLDADPLGPGPDQVANAHGFAVRRKPELGPVARWYVFEPSMTLTGACADHRAPVRPELVRNVALVLSGAAGASAATIELPPDVMTLAKAAARDLSQHPGRVLVLAGRGQPPEVHALAAWVQHRLQAPIDPIAPVDPIPDPHDESLAGVAADLHAGRIHNLILLDCNPVYDAPAQLGFAQGLTAVPFTLHAGLYRDETGAAARWHVPLSHALESWGDARASDGTASLVQPLIRTLYDTRTSAQIVDLIGAPVGRDARDLVQDAWRGEARGDFTHWWRQALIEGVIAGTAAKSISLPAPRKVDLAPAHAGPALTLTLTPSSTVWDGSRAANAWLQECPDPLTKEVWGASLRIGRGDAERLGVGEGDVLRVSSEGRDVEAPAHIVSGQAPGVVTLPLGGGRQGESLLSHGVGANGHPLRKPLTWSVPGIQLKRTGARRPTPATPSDIKLVGELGALFPVLAPGQTRSGGRALPSLLPTKPPLPQREHAWAMVIDTSVCIGCNACVVACQAENNVPVIGPEEIAANRDMHWLRIDRYDTGTEIDPQPGFQPVPCMHCEAAPCEPVCPVEASVHDSEGLNVQVYNRCIGTRFCEANCPYKVRRFNFKDYAEPHVYPVDDARSIEAQRNPEVSVRARGVMEKCTYCVQRISAARRESEKTGAPIQDGAVKTACQQACPTNAIVFGDLNDPDSAVSRLRKSGRHYALLEDLGTRPRTTYLAKVRQPPRGGKA
jgi:molybdopterin-containing oxidoreductase family iron-sulfur binding subunit